MNAWCVHATMLLFALGTTGCGTHPTPLYSARDIQRTSKDTERIVIGFLPVSDYPLLSKFNRLKGVSFLTTDGTGANDQKLEALSRLKLDKLHDITLLNCPAVTDAGIRHLSRIKTIRLLQLEGTSITDKALEIMASQMKLRGVNVANCPKVTMEGLLKLAPSETLSSFTFPANALTQEDVKRLIKEFKPNLKWPDVVDPEGKLDAAYLKALAKERGFKLRISRTGAIQDLGLKSR